MREFDCVIWVYSNPNNYRQTAGGGFFDNYSISSGGNINGYSTTDDLSCALHIHDKMFLNQVVEYFNKWNIVYKVLAW